MASFKIIIGSFHFLSDKTKKKVLFFFYLWKQLKLYDEDGF